MRNHRLRWLCLFVPGQSNISPVPSSRKGWKGICRWVCCNRWWPILLGGSMPDNRLWGPYILHLRHNAIYLGRAILWLHPGIPCPDREIRHQWLFPVRRHPLSYLIAIGLLPVFLHSAIVRLSAVSLPSQNLRWWNLLLSLLFAVFGCPGRDRLVRWVKLYFPDVS